MVCVYRSSINNSLQQCITVCWSRLTAHKHVTDVEGGVEHETACAVAPSPQHHQYPRGGGALPPQWRLKLQLLQGLSCQDANDQFARHIHRLRFSRRSVCSSRFSLPHSSANKTKNNQFAARAAQTIDYAHVHPTCSSKHASPKSTRNRQRGTCTAFLAQLLEQHRAAAGPRPSSGRNLGSALVLTRGRSKASSRASPGNTGFSNARRSLADCPNSPPPP